MIALLFSVLILLVAIGGSLFVAVMLKKRASAGDEQVKKNIGIIKHEIKLKEDALRELAQLALGLATQRYFDDLGEQVRNVEEELRAERGRLTITDAELEAVDIRLRELEELKRELEMSNIDAIRELDLLRAQERDMSSQNDALRGQLRSSSEQLDMLLDMLASSAEAVAHLQAAKTQLVIAEQKTQFYEEQITLVNQKYVSLKRAYDALDIEYAQLYEKQQQAANA